MRPSPSLYINPAQSRGCWTGTTESKHPSFELHSRQLKVGIKQTPDTSILSSKNYYPGRLGHGAVVRSRCPTVYTSLLCAVRSSREAQPAPGHNGSPEVALLGWAGLPELLLSPTGTGTISPCLHDGGSPSPEALLPSLGDRARQYLRVPAGQGTVWGGAGRHSALEWPLHSPKCGWPGTVAPQVLQPQLSVHRWDGCWGQGMGMEGSVSLAPKARDSPGGIRHPEGFKYYYYPKSSSIFMILLVLFQNSRVKEVFFLMWTSVFSSLPMELSP